MKTYPFEDSLAAKHHPYQADEGQEELICSQTDEKPYVEVGPVGSNYCSPRLYLVATKKYYARNYGQSHDRKAKDTSDVPIDVLADQTASSTDGNALNMHHVFGYLHH